MVVQVISSSLMASDLTRHNARSVGEGWWDASWRRGCAVDLAARRGYPA